MTSAIPLYRRLFLLALIAALTGISPPSGAAAEIATLPADVNPAIRHLLRLVADGKGQAPDIETTRPLIDFVQSDKPADTLFCADDTYEGTSAYYEFLISADLDHILKRNYHPDMPGHAFSPGSVRRSEWKIVNGLPQKQLPKLWQLLSDLESPQVVTGIEYAQITPDPFSGAYYAYDSKRTIILMRENGSNVMISLTKQAGRSEVGKQGAVLGSANNRHFLYSGRDGISRKGLGWVKSYMYDSAAIIVYIETPQKPKQVKMAILKWVRAGWLKINMVKPHHILTGMKRFAETFKSLLELPHLPPPEDLVSVFDRLAQMPQDNLDRKVRQYLDRLSAYHQNNGGIKTDWAADLIGSDQYIAAMTRPEKEALLVTALMNYYTGKAPERDWPGVLPEGSSRD